MTTTTSKPTTIATVRYPAPIHMMATTDHSRPALTGVRFEGDHSGTRIFAADGFRLATYTNGDACEDEFDVLVPGKFAAELWKQVKAKKTPEYCKELLIRSDGKVGFMDADTNELRLCDPIGASSPDFAKLLKDAIDKSTGGWKQNKELFEVSFNPPFLKGIGEFFKACDVKHVKWIPGPHTGAQIFLGVYGQASFVSVLQMPMFTLPAELDKIEDWFTTKNLKLRSENETLAAKNRELEAEVDALRPAPEVTPEPIVGVEAKPEPKECKHTMKCARHKRCISTTLKKPCSYECEECFRGVKQGA